MYLDLCLDILYNYSMLQVNAKWVLHVEIDSWLLIELYVDVRLNTTLNNNYSF